MKKQVFIISLLFILGCSPDPPMPVFIPPDTLEYSNFLELVSQIEQSDNAFAHASAFFDTIKRTPIIEGNDVYFIINGNGSQMNHVRVSGDFIDWRESAVFTRVQNTHLWYQKYDWFEPDARLEYKIIIDGAFKKDPYNPSVAVGGYGTNSELAMPMYVSATELLNRDDVRKGTIESFNYSSKFTGRSYQIQVYLPADYDQNISYPAAYFQDGHDYLEYGQAKRIFDNIIHDEKIESTLGIFIQPTNRNTEYAGELRHAYQQFFVHELVPYIDSTYSTAREAGRRAVIGDSFGGNISALIAFNNPGTFANCGIQSGAFFPNSYEANKVIMEGGKRDIHIVSIWGKYEPTFAENMRTIKDYLISENYEITWAENPEGHNWGHWRATIDEILTTFFKK